jgi:hypothetical protein
LTLIPAIATSSQNWLAGQFSRLPNQNIGERPKLR